jgi:hypothetical protein
MNERTDELSAPTILIKSVKFGIIIDTKLIRMTIAEREATLLN